MKFKIFLFTCLLGLSFLAKAQPYASMENTPQATSSFATLFGSVDYSKVPGYVNPEDYAGITCFDFMGTVDFTSSYRFITSYTGTTPPTGWKGGKLNADNRHLVAFSMPYVADLNGDGYPEIIGIGQLDGGASLYGYFSYVYVYDGRTGLEVARLPFATSGTLYTYTQATYHTSPSIAALVDSDRDGIVEIICAFPSLGNTDLASHVVSYEIEPSGTTYTMRRKWISVDKYTRNVAAGSDGFYRYEKATPQICDLNGDGRPEVLVYNKVYDAVNGDLLVEMETITTSTTYTAISDAFMGCNLNAYGGEYRSDRYISMPYIYDINLDGIYDVIAGGKIYLMKENPLTKKPELDRIIRMTGVEDGYTGVADINGDGKADIVVVNRAGTGNRSDIVITVWNPGFDANGANENPKLVAPPFHTAVTAWGDDTGTNSYVYIGDIDGREQEVGGKKYRLPEIAILTRRIDLSSFTQHSNIAGISEANGGIPTTYNWNSPQPSTSRVPSVQGCIFGVTFDVENNDLRGSFVMEHFDRSINTGFTMFDFDNDGIQEICYRDEGSLRVIKPKIPFIRGNFVNKVGDGGITNQQNDIARPDVILFSKKVQSFTGFEYPVIADIDNDASAEMVVVGHQDGDWAFGYMYALGSAGDKFAPALSVWNQFMYDPFKINVDLTTPIGPAPNRLEMKYTLNKVVRDGDMEVREVVEDYNPFNGTLIQMSKFQVGQIEWEGKKYENAYEPIIFLTHAYFVEPNKTNPAKNPVIVKEGTQAYIKAWVGNEAKAQTDVSQNTPIAVYKNEISKTTLENIIPLLEMGVSSPIKAGQENEREIKIPINDEFGFYILRLGDNSFNINTKVFEKWSWGTNDLHINDEVNCKGTAARAYRDCNWNDQMLKVSKFMVADDAYTLQDFDKIEAPILNNDILPDDFIGGFDGANPNIRIKTQPKSGILTTSGNINNVTGVNTVKVLYQHTGSVKLPEGIDVFEYEVSYYDGATSTTKTLSAKAYFYILQNVNRQYTVCKGDNLNIELAVLPTGTTFKWYQGDGVTELPNNPQNSISVTNVTSNLNYKVLPQVPSSNALYGNINFPKGDLTIRVVADDNTALKWTGAVNNLWYNPFNWSDMSGSPVKFTPAGCIAVTIPMVSTNYPELEATAQCGNLILEDRAQISNVHKLTYTTASMELKIKDAEQNRWLMLSAPLRAMYAGDYKAKSSQGTQIERASYISLYHSENPDNGLVAENSALSRPFGKIEQPLGLGVGFMLYVDKMYGSSPTYKFPSSLDKYLYTPSSVVGAASRSYESAQLSRLDGSGKNVSGRFVFEGASNYDGTTGSFTLTLNDEVYHLVVNPFPSYLNLKTFLASNTMLEPQYKIWTGKSDDTFMTLVGGNNQAPRWVINPSATLVNVDLSEGAEAIYVAPYQAFFVKKKSTGAGSSSISFVSETMTKTKAGDYTL